MKIKHIWTLLCRRSVIDNETNNLSLYDILEQLTIKINVKKNSEEKIYNINIPIEYEVISFWTKSPDISEFNGELKLDIVNPKGKILKFFEKPLTIPKDKRRLRSRIRISGFIADMEGIYTFRMNYRETAEDQYTKTADIPLEVFIEKKLYDDSNENINKSAKVV